ncbi:MAG: UDP-glucose 4-epimerase GalE [Lachnospiraceae bacterium]|jgi:UDP-glucose 4-epimerase|uniref:UDP-glucose 4-epimerase GalE n=1 Tax=Porcincola sp. LCP21S3_C12 TaxID=3438798 RepID=UPI002974A99B|nr:UDP-glucose 4-epimerase GalE [Lachnospiraceae bacterium]
MRILVTGGAGFIGSHTCVELLNAGYEVTVVDNLYNASEKAIDRVREITGRDLTFVKGDILDKLCLDQIFESQKIDAVIHFAGLKAVGESVHKPVEYYSNNITGTLNLIESMRSHGCKNIIFSSSATVYGDPAFVPITEECPKGTCTNPYGWTKWMLEQILIDVQKADPEWNVILLRYFNPIGAHPSGLLGEDPKGIPNNLVPYIAQVAIGKLKELSVFGNDYDTPDGTGVRDYIHVCDLARGHVNAIRKFADNEGVSIYNLGTGHGYSVLQVVKAFSKACGKEIPYVIKPRRAGDIATCYCDPSKAARELGWKAEYGIEEMCRDSWNWQQKNPNGFAD